MAQSGNGFTPAAVPGYSVTPPPGVQLTQAIEAGPQNAADKATALETAKAAKAQAQLSEQDSSNKILQGLVAPAVSNPTIAASPQWQKMVQDKLTTQGLEIPKTQGGDIDVQALQNMVAPVVKPMADAAGLAKALEIPAGPARDAALTAFNPASIDPSIKDAPMVPSQAVIEDFAKGYQQSLLAAQEGKVAPAAFIAGLRKDMLPYIGTSWGAVNNDKLLVAGMGQKTQADIQKLVDLHVLTPYKAQMILSNIQKNTSVESMNAARTKYLGVQSAGYDSRTQAMLANASAHSQTAQAFADKAAQDIANAAHGTWADRAKLNRQYTADTNTQLKEAYSDSRLIGQAIATAQGNSVDPTLPVGGQPSLTDQLAEAQSRITSLKGIAAQVADPTLSAAAANNTLNAVGGSSVSNTTQGAPEKFNPATALKSNNPKYPNRAFMPDPSHPQHGTEWDTSANPPRFIRNL
jgi:hypothetical protein